MESPDSLTAGAPGMKAKPNMHMVIDILRLHWYRVHPPFHWLFTARFLFWSCSSQIQLWCLTKEFPLVFWCVWLCLCACVWSQEGYNRLSPQIRAISGFRSHRPCLPASSPHPSFCHPSFVSPYLNHALCLRPKWPISVFVLEHLKIFLLISVWHLFNSAHNQTFGHTSSCTDTWGFFLSLRN